MMKENKPTLSQKDYENYKKFGHQKKPGEHVGLANTQAFEIAK